MRDLPWYPPALPSILYEFTGPAKRSDSGHLTSKASKSGGGGGGEAAAAREEAAAARREAAAAKEAAASELALMRRELASAQSAAADAESALADAEKVRTSSVCPVLSLFLFLFAWPARMSAP